MNFDPINLSFDNKILFFSEKFQFKNFKFSLKIAIFWKLRIKFLKKKKMKLYYQKLGQMG